MVIYFSTLFWLAVAFFEFIYIVNEVYNWYKYPLWPDTNGGVRNDALMRYIEE